MRWPVALLEGCDIDDLDGGQDDNRRYKSLSHGPMPEIVTTASQVDAIQAAIEHVLASTGEEASRYDLPSA